MRVFNVPLTLNRTQMNAAITSTPIALLNMFGYSIDVQFSGTPTGSFKLQASNDPIESGVPNPPQPTHWTDVTDSPYSVTASGAYMWNVYDVMYNWVRLVYTDGSGGTSTAVITSAIFNGKGI